MNTKNATKLNRKANKCEVTGRASRPGIYDVRSPSGGKYVVDLNRGGVCNCAWGLKGGAGCAHEIAARKFQARQHGRKVSFQDGDAKDVARRQHKRAVPINSGTAMVIRDKIEMPKPEPAPTAPRVVRVAFLWDRLSPPDDMDVWLVKREDTTVRNGDGTWRRSKMSLDDLLDLRGWEATDPRMVRGNERPGWHRYEFEMIESV